jgi:UDP-N-acetylmuramate dehydrogenase
MQIKQNININNSLNIKCTAKYFVEIVNSSDLNELSKYLKNTKIKYFIIGDCTNVVLPDYYDGLIIKYLNNDIKYSNRSFSVGASYNWSDLVDLCNKKGIPGFENLALIPGSVGAAPIQNIGAYGVEVSSLIESVDCFNLENGEFTRIEQNGCNFAYRKSIFQSTNYLILNVNFKIHNELKLNVSYSSISDYLKQNNINSENLTRSDLSSIIKTIRNSKLPLPTKIPNVGSFFKNPIVPKKNINSLLSDIVSWDVDEKLFKLSAANLIDNIKVELKNNKNVGLYDLHSLVIVSKSNQISQLDVLSYADQIRNLVKNKFSINLEIEPEIVS